MNRIGKIEFKKIKRISPSQFYSMKNCAYKSLLAEAFEKKPLLPLSPNAYVGTVLHRVLELISSGEIKDDIELTRRFNAEIAIMEERLTGMGYSFFVPLKLNVKDFGTRQIQLKKHLRTDRNSSAQQKSIKYIPEKWLESKDKLVGGKIDLIIDDGVDIEIVDFKTGAIKEDTFDDNGDLYQDVKDEYQMQLKLYAYLFFDCMGRFPTQLSLVDLTRQKFNVDFSIEECIAIFEESKRILFNTNECIETRVFNANPSESNCRYCLYRPACSFYLQYQDTESIFNDVCGLVKNVVQYRNGSVSVFIQKGDQTITIIGFAVTQFEVLVNSKNNRLNIFNLKKQASEFVYSATKTTMIYG